MLAGAGVPILQGPAGGGRNAEQPRHARRREDALVLVREGAPLASALAQKKRFPGPAGHVRPPGRADRPAAGDAAARRHQLSAEVQRRALQLATILEPLLIVAMGLVVMLIVLAVLLPIIQLNQLVPRWSQRVPLRWRHQRVVPSQACRRPRRPSCRRCRASASLSCQAR
jgi:general secretion pathway protein F